MKVAIVHDSPAIIGTLTHAVRSVPGWSVAWTATNGADALRAFAAQCPDVLLVRVEMPDLDAAALTRRVIGDASCPVVLLTDGADTTSHRVFEAMAAGAAGVVPVPAVGADGRLSGTDEVVQRIRVASRLGRRDRPPEDGPGAAPAEGKGVVAARTGAELRPPVSSVPPLVVLGASTGGPPAVAMVLGALPVTCRAAIVVVQHVGEEFSDDLAAWIGGRVRLGVRAAGRGATPTPGTIVLAGGDEDLIMTPDGTFDYRRPTPGSYYHPSVDVFFRSLADHWPSPGLAVLLTGIGRDGAEGLLALRQKGWRTIAQDEASSVVYGMPRAAAQLKAASLVLPLDHIGPAVARFAATASGSSERLP